MKTQSAPAHVGRLVYRQVTFSVEAFDRLKNWQRHLERREGRKLTNGAVLDRLILLQDPPHISR